jgi:Putative Actinobacterial Holin-X, holin superfamily III
MIMSQVEDATSRGTLTDPGNQSIAELIKQVSEESSRLLRSELKLAQAEMTEKAKTAGVGIGAFGAAAVLGWFALGCFLPPRSWRWP